MTADLVPKYDFECVHRLELPVSSEFWVTKNAYFDVVVLGTLKRFSRLLIVALDFKP